jgi:hypothetical protein
MQNASICRRNFLVLSAQTPPWRTRRSPKSRLSAVLQQPDTIGSDSTTSPADIREYSTEEVRDALRSTARSSGFI